MSTIVQAANGYHTGYVMTITPAANDTWLFTIDFPDKWVYDIAKSMSKDQKVSWLESNCTCTHLPFEFEVALLIKSIVQGTEFKEDDTNRLYLCYGTGVSITCKWLTNKFLFNTW